jgi:hypothetical protein
MSAVVPAKNTLPAEMAKQFKGDSNIGRETMGLSDLALPYLAILQALSPQVVKANPKRIPDAEEGDLFNTVTQDLYAGSEGVTVVPCAYQRANVEWMPRDSGGGFVAQHIGDEILSRTTRDERGFDVLQNGNLVITTAYYYCLLVEPGHNSPVVLSMARTQLKKARRWNSVMGGIQATAPDGSVFNPPMFSHLYKVTTVPEAKKNYNWFGFNIEMVSMIQDSGLYHAARKLAVDVSKGLVKAAVPEQGLDDVDVDSRVRDGKDSAGDDIPF